MRGSAAFRTSVTPGGALAGPWVRNPLWNAARSVPSLDLRFAENKSLVDATTGQNLVTFTRASSGTYVDSQGVIRTTTTNLLLRSEEFDNASWGKTSTTVTANSTAAPNGTTTADTLTWGALSTAEIYQFVALTATTHIFSIWARSASGTKKFRLKYYNGTSDLFSTEFTATTTWQQFSYSFTGVAVSGNVSVRNSSPAEAGDLIVWGAQLEQSSTVGEYIPTTSTINSAPRFDHNPTTGESLGLLVEEQRTNLNTNSEAFDTYSITSGTVSANQGAAPNGSITADEITSTGAGAFKNISGTTASASFTASVYAKYVSGGGNFTFGFDVNPSSGRSSFNLQNGTIVSNEANVTASSITAVGGGWYRCVVTATVTSTNTILVFYNATSGAKWLCWGAQLEAGSFPTSYIPTTTAAVTRSADVASITGGNFSSWYNQTEGTVFANFLPGNLSANGTVFEMGDGSLDNRWNIESQPSTSLRTWSRVNVSNILQIDIPINNTLSLAIPTKSAVAIGANNTNLSANGIVGITDTNCSVPTIGKMQIGNINTAAGSALNGTIKRLTYFPTRLANETLQRITQ